MENTRANFFAEILNWNRNDKVNSEQGCVHGWTVVQRVYDKTEDTESAENSSPIVLVRRTES